MDWIEEKIGAVAHISGGKIYFDKIIDETLFIDFMYHIDANYRDMDDGLMLIEYSIREINDGKEMYISLSDNYIVILMRKLKLNNILNTIGN